MGLVRSLVCRILTVTLVSLFLICQASTSASTQKTKQTRRLLVVTVTKGFRHESIPVAERVIESLGRESGKFTVDFARSDEELQTKTTPAALKRYDGVIFAQTTGDIPLADRAAFLDYIRAGHAFIGIHSATDTFHNYPDFIKMIGGEFDSHGAQVSVTMRVADRKHPATKHLGATYTVMDEIYRIKNFGRDNVHVLLDSDRHPNTGVQDYHPLAWASRYGRGRVFYTALGHREDVLESTDYRQHLLGGILWALREAKGSDKPNLTKKSGK
jgi:type 1 glutamine amidotransferase